MALALSSPPSLRPYQEQAISLTRRSWDAGNDRTYISLPTGTGKTVVMSQLTESFDRVLFLAHRIELIGQIAERLQTDWRREVGIVMGRRNDIAAELVVATPQSLHKDRLAEILSGDQRFDAVFIDEAHHAVPRSRYDTIISAAAEAAPVSVLGVTATPFRADKRRMQDLLPVCTFSRTIDDMQRDGWLCPLRWRRIRVDMDLSNVATVQSPEGMDYKIEQLAVEAEQDDVVESIVEMTRGAIEGRPTLAFGVTVLHAQMLADAYNRAGISAAAIWGEMPRDERAQVLADWRAGRIHVVSNCAVLTEGFDFPKIGALVVTRPTQSPSLYTQMVGRGTRTAEGKPDCLVIDVSGNEPVDVCRQVILADVASVQEYEDFLDEEEGTASQRRLPGVSPSRRLLVRDPSHDQVWRWVRGEHGYLLSASGGSTLVMLADPDGSGLFHLGILYGGPGRIERLSERPEPIWELQRLAHDWLTDHGMTYLGGQGQPWHDKPASERQLAFLRALNPGVATEYAGRSRVEVSEMISRLLAGRYLRSLYGTLWSHEVCR